MDQPTTSEAISEKTYRFVRDMDLVKLALAQKQEKESEEQRLQKDFEYHLSLEGLVRPNKLQSKLETEPVSPAILDQIISIQSKTETLPPSDMRSDLQYLLHQYNTLLFLFDQLGYETSQWRKRCDYLLYLRWMDEVKSEMLKAKFVPKESTVTKPSLVPGIF